MNRKQSESMAYDDIFFSVVLAVIGVYASGVNWNESDWWGLFDTVMLTLFSLLWFSARVYHLTHKDEVFGKEEPEE